MHTRTCNRNGICPGTPAVSYDTDSGEWTANCAVCRHPMKPGATRDKALQHWNEQLSAEPPASAAVPKSTRKR